MADQSNGSTRETLRTIPLSRIVVPDGFNPRGAVAEDADLEALAQTMRQRGCLQPVRVRATDDGDYVRVAGGRRYRAAVKAALTELPAVVRPAGAGDESEELDLLVDAVIENELRVDLDPLQRALGYRRMLDGGLTVKGVAEKLGVRQARVKSALSVLRLPEELWPRVASGEIPMAAVAPLVKLAAIHPALPARAAAQVLDLEAEHREAFEWADVAQDALQVALSGDEPMPAGVYVAHASYPLEAFELGEKARRDLASLAKAGAPLESVRFDGELVEQARALGACHDSGYSAVIVGQAVADQLAGDYIARVLKRQREVLKRRREWERKHAERDAAESAEAVSAEGRLAREEADAKARREEERAERERAITFNAEFGAAVYARLSKVRVDARVTKILSAV